MDFNSSSQKGSSPFVVCKLSWGFLICAGPPASAPLSNTGVETQMILMFFLPYLPSFTDIVG